MNLLTIYLPASLFIIKAELNIDKFGKFILQKLKTIRISFVMINRFNYLIILYSLLNTSTLSGQESILPDSLLAPEKYSIEFRRLVNHEAIDKQQNLILASDNKADSVFTPSNNEEANFILTLVLTKKVDAVQYLIETELSFNHRLKVKYLKGLENLLRYYRANWKSKSSGKVNPFHLPLVINAYWECINKDKTDSPIESIATPLPYDVITSLLNADIFNTNPSYKSIQDIHLLKLCALYPKETLATLNKYPTIYFADSLIRIVAKKYPVQLYNYAQSNSKFGVFIRNIKDDALINTISKMAAYKTGQQYFPFLDNIIRGKLSIEQIREIENDSVLYYKLLVKTQMEYAKRMLEKDTAIGIKELTAKLERKAQDVFVTTINGLHEQPDATRFKCIQTLSAEELYYLAVMSDGIIYTSSYTRGIYPLMMKKIDGHVDSLLMNLSFDRYRKFISQAAAYNTLGDFLSHFANHDDADILMKAFVGGLEKAEELEDGVDVADSYASIVETLKPRAVEMLNNIQANYERSVEENNQKGTRIYNILYKLFRSADSSNKVNLTAELGIPSVYNVPFSLLSNKENEVIIQMFFYGDQDGKLDYSIFQKMFTATNWKVDNSNSQWTVVKSIKGKSVKIFANKPFDEETGEDDEAQKALANFFAKNNIFPTITINRGHSYHAKTTIEYMSETSKIVFMGSCGGFHLIDAILKKADDAHIISSKQIGKRDINNPFILLLVEKLRSGQDINWISFWKELKNVSAEQGFEDYIPPHKNLGALFIKAYTFASSKTE